MMVRQAGFDRRQRFRSNVCLGVIAGGLFMTMVEPRILLGTFQISVMWWAFAGVVCASALRKQVREHAVVATQPPQALMNFV
jgi:hypothetical protein